MKKQTIFKDPVCGKKINRNKAYVVLEYKDHVVFICCPKCQAEFEKEPERYIK